MKFLSNKDVLAQAVIFVTKLLTQKSTNPTLAGVRIDATDKGVMLSTLDNDVSTRITIEAEVETPGSVLVSGKLLTEIATRLPGDTVSINLEESKLHVISANAKFNLSIMPLNEYPNLPELPEIIGSFDGEKFSEAISQVGVAALKEDGSPAIQNIFFEIFENEISFTATDRFRIASRNISWKASGAAKEEQVLIPARVLIEAGKMFQTATEVSLGLLAGGEREIISIQAGTKIVTSSLAKGSFPKVKALLDEKGAGSYAIVLASDLVDATKRVSLVTENRETAIHFVFSESGVLVETGTGEKASASETVPAHLVGEEISVWLKPKFVVDGVSCAHSEFVRLGFTPALESGKAGPVMVTAHSSKDSVDVQRDYRYLMQPNLLQR